jgi:large subunit ribosomal protein L20
MTKVKHTPSSLKRRKKIRKAAKGQFGARSRRFRTAKEAVRKGLILSYIGRKKKKGNFRSLWIARISALCKEEGTSYSKFMASLKKAGIILNRKMLADIASSDKRAFKALVKEVNK